MNPRSGPARLPDGGPPNGEPPGGGPLPLRAGQLSGPAAADGSGVAAGAQQPGPAGAVRGRGGPGAGNAEQLDRLGNHLAMAALRLARLRARLDSSEDRLMLIEARYDLDEAIAEVRRLALNARQGEGN